MSDSPLPELTVKEQPTHPPPSPATPLPSCLFSSFTQALAPFWVPELGVGEGSVDNMRQGYLGDLCTQLG